jgi:hypothetical protein
MFERNILVDLEKNKIIIITKEEREIFDNEGVFILERDLSGYSYIKKEGNKYFLRNVLYEEDGTSRIIQDVELEEGRVKEIIRDIIENEEYDE